MKTVKNLLVTTALAFGIAGFAQAQSADQAPKGPEHKMEQGHGFKKGFHHEGHRSFGLFSPKLIEELKLTDDQKAKYEAIGTAKKSLAESHKESAQKLEEERKSLLAAEVVDLKALLENGDKFHEEMTNAKNDLRVKTLEFWDSLDTEQKTKASKSLKEKQERMDKFKDKRGDKNDKKHAH